MIKLAFLNVNDKIFQLTIGAGTEPSEVFRSHFCSIFQRGGEKLLHLLFVIITYLITDPSISLRRRRILFVTTPCNIILIH